MRYCVPVAADAAMSIFHGVDDATDLVAHLLLHGAPRADTRRDRTTWNPLCLLIFRAAESFAVSARVA